MKSATLLFLFSLGVAHGLSGDPSPIDLPLSMFRDDGRPILGFALFLQLLTIAALLLVRCFRYDRVLEGVLFTSAAFLLAVVAVTPSRHFMHEMCALLLLFGLYAYFALALYGRAAPLFFVHVLAPLLIGLLTGWRSYGVWQKGMIVYFACGAALYFDLFPDTLTPEHLYSRKSSIGPNRRKVHVIDPRREWRGWN